METISLFNGNNSSPKLNYHNMGKIISKNKKREYLSFIKDNFNNISQREIARRLKIGKTIVNKWAKEIGLKFTKHTVNDNFFNSLDENSYYILGFIFADGNISWNVDKGYYSLTITASEKDKSHLEKIRKLLESTKPLLFSPKTKSHRLIVNNKKLCQTLINLGVVPRKSLKVRFPKIPPKYLSHFLRGIVDGDGSVLYCDRKVSPYFCIRISSGSRKFLEDLTNQIKRQLKIKSTIQKWGKNVYLTEYSCSRGKKFAEFIYANAQMFLERKYLVYKKNVLEVK